MSPSARRATRAPTPISTLGLRLKSAICLYVRASLNKAYVVGSLEARYPQPLPNCRSRGSLNKAPVARCNLGPPKGAPIPHFAHRIYRDALGEQRVAWHDSCVGTVH